MSTMFEDFLEYCGEDNPKLKDDIETWLCDFFDLSHRTIELSEEERSWIVNNLSVSYRDKILGGKIRPKWHQNYNEEKQKILKHC